MSQPLQSRNALVAIRSIRAPLAIAVLVLAGCLAGCAPPRTEALAPREGRAGLRFTGTVAGRQIVVNDGLPDLVVADCDPGTGADRDVCFISQELNGQLVVISLENPGVLRAGADLAVADPDCAETGCDAVSDVAVVDVQIGVGERTRATGGRLTLDVVEPFQRYAGTLRLELPDGRLSGQFDVIPPPED